MSPFTDQDVQLDIFGNGMPAPEHMTREEYSDELRRRDRLDDLTCTSDYDCRAEADQHDPDCPVEQRLKDELGF